MEIRLISVVEKNQTVRARIRAQAPEIGATIWLEIRFSALIGATRRQWVEEAYDRALAVLDPA